MEGIEKIHQQELLVLLFVVKPQFHERKHISGRILEELLQRFIHIAPPAQNLSDRGTAEQAPLGPGMTVADGVVIGIELIAPARITDAMVRYMRLENEGFKEPCGVGQMPFGRTGIRHSLKAKILWFKGSDQSFCLGSHRTKGWGEKQRDRHGCCGLRRRG